MAPRLHRRASQLICTEHQSPHQLNRSLGASQRPTAHSLSGDVRLVSCLRSGTPGLPRAGGGPASSSRRSAPGEINTGPIGTKPSRHGTGAPGRQATEFCTRTLLVLGMVLVGSRDGSPGDTRIRSAVESSPPVRAAPARLSAADFPTRLRWPNPSGGICP